MFFTRIGQVLAWLLFIFGAARAGMGLIVAFNFENSLAAQQRYLGGTSSGDAIDRGIYVLLLGVALGIAVEISKSLARRQTGS